MLAFINLSILMNRYLIFWKIAYIYITMSINKIKKLLKILRVQKGLIYNTGWYLWLIILIIYDYFYYTYSKFTFRKVQAYLFIYLLKI